MNSSKLPVQEIIDLYDSGLSCSAIGGKFGCSGSTILYHIRKHRKVRRGYPTTLGRKLSIEEIVKRTATRKLLHPGRASRSGNHPGLGISEGTWLKQLIIKRNFICSVSGKVGGKLDAHHLYNVKNNPEKQWDEDNIVVVSRDIHRMFHSQFMRSPHVKAMPIDWHNFLLEYKAFGQTVPRGESHIVSNEQKKKISIALTGRHLSMETRAKLSLIKKGHICTEETRQKIREAMLGKKIHTDESKKKIGSYSKERHLPCKPETKRKISITLKRRACGSDHNRDVNAAMVVFKTGAGIALEKIAV